MRFGFAGHQEKLACGFTACALMLGFGGCDRAGQAPQAQPPAQAVPTKADPRKVMPPGGPYARLDGAASARDRALTAKVRTALDGEGGIAGTGIAVSTIGGRVLLSGALPQAQIARAVQVAQAVQGVHAVDNRLAATG